MKNKNKKETHDILKVTAMKSKSKIEISRCEYKTVQFFNAYKNDKCQ